MKDRPTKSSPSNKVSGERSLGIRSSGISKPKNLRDAFSNPRVRLRHAASTGNHFSVVEIARTLTPKDLDAGDDKGRTALHFAAAGGHLSIARSLIKAGCDVNVRDANQNTPLHLAVISNKIALVSLLLESGADLQVVDKYQRSPLEMVQSRLNLLRRAQATSSLTSQLLELIRLLKSYAVRVRRKSTQLEAIPEDISSSLDSLAEHLQHQVSVTDTDTLEPSPSGTESMNQNHATSDELMDRLQNLLDKIKLL